MGSDDRIAGITDPDTEGPRALIVEDDHGWASLLANAFHECGYIVTIVSSAFDARAQLRNCRFDVAVIDLILDPYDRSPEGLRIVEALDTLGDPTYVVLISAIDSRSLVSHSLIRFPSIEFLRKSEISPNRLQALIKTATEQQQRLVFPRGIPPSEHLRELWQEVVVTDAKKKGKLLEDFAAQFLSLIPAFELVERNYRTASSEIDLVFAIRQVQGTSFQDWGSLLLVECRNRSEPVDAKGIRDFARKIQKADARVGLVLSPLGVTGGGLSDAGAEVAVFFAETKRRILVVQREDIDGCLNGGTTLMELLDQIDRRVRLSF